MTGSLQVSIDGPTAAGKTTLGMGLARYFGAAFLDTGLTYRALGYLLALEELPKDDSWKSMIEHIPSSSDGSPEEVIYNSEHEEITDRLWDFKVDSRLDLVSRDPARRAQIASYHREIIAARSRLIVAGRDVATTLLPNALLHVFLNADFTVRRERRRLQHGDNPGRSVVVGVTTSRDLETLESLENLPHSMILDTTYLSADSILNQAIDHIDGALLSRCRE
jgi:CMP/dCMP kinase